MPSTISENSGVSTVTATLAHPVSAATTITVRPVADAYTVGSDSTITIAAREHGERVGHGGHHGLGQRDRCAEQFLDRVRCGEQ